MTRLPKRTTMPLIAAHVADKETMNEGCQLSFCHAIKTLLLQVDIVPREERGDEGLSSRPSQPGMPAAGMNQSKPSAWPVHLPTLICC